MMKNLRPKTADEYVNLVDEAVIEVDELMACIEFDTEEPGDQLRVLEPLLASLKTLRNSMADGSYQFDNKDLPFMTVANKMSSQLPFSQLLSVINDTHRYGLNTETD